MDLVFLGWLGSSGLDSLWLLGSQQRAGTSQDGSFQVLAVSVVAQGVSDLAEDASRTAGVLEGDAVQALGRLVTVGLLASGQDEALLVSGWRNADGLLVNEAVVSERVAAENVVWLLFNDQFNYLSFNLPKKLNQYSAS